MKIKIGGFEIYPLMDGYFWLDGGMMFRQAKNVWQNLYQPDALNRIKLAARCYLIKGKVLTLFDTGIGDPSDPMFPELKGLSYGEFFSVDQSGGNLIGNLEGAGFGKGDLRFVSQSHLHSDHTGCHAFTNHEGKIAPTFPNATYLMHHKEWEAATRDHPLSLKSYLQKNLLPLNSSPMANFGSVWQIRRGNYHESERGLTFIRTGGHTEGHWVALIESEGKKALLAGDLIPTHKHIVPINVMSYDLYPTRVYKEKVRLLNLAAREKWLILFDHDPDHVGGYVAKNKKGHFEFHPLERGE